MLRSLFHSIRCRGMRVKKPRFPGFLAHERDFAFEAIQEDRQGARVPSGLRCHLLSHSIRLSFLAAAVGRKEHALRQIADSSDDIPGERNDQPREPRRDSEHRGKWTLPGNLLYSVPRSDVTDLMPDHTGEFILGIHEGEQSSTDIDIAA